MHVVDHLVLHVTTLTLARMRFVRLGFHVAPDQQHPDGTGSCRVFFEDRTYIEPMTLLDRTKADMAAAEGSVFIKRLRRYIGRHGEGLAMVALRTEDPDADCKRFRREGIDCSETAGIVRHATLADGSEAEMQSTIAIADVSSSPDATFYTCWHEPTDAAQAAPSPHPNGAIGISGVSAVAENPADFHILLTAVTGQRELRATSFGVEAVVNGQRFELLTPEGFRARYGVAPPDQHRRLVFAAIDVVVSDLDQATRFGGADAVRHDERIIVPPMPGQGAVIAFGAAHG